LTESDFKGTSGTIFKVIYHDDPRFTLVGETFDCNSQQNIGGINTILSNTVNKTSISQISDVEGKFIYQLEAQSEFTVVANQQGKYSQTELVSTKGLDRSQTLYVTLKLGVCDLVKDSSWELKNILYDFDKSNIRPDAAIILDNVVAILKQNPSLKIELSSHTDSRGNDAYNLSLSQRRADAAVEYLVDNGISRNRLGAKGYGETRLKNDCGNGMNCSEAQHQENRRTEIKVLEF
jgi:outer membrane protein OmpA-like peptidoglycan-associated protein